MQQIAPLTRHLELNLTSVPCQISAPEIYFNKPLYSDVDLQYMHHKKTTNVDISTLKQVEKRCC